MTIQNSDQHPGVAVIGAGISGLTCARVLASQGLQVTVFEKSRGLGGRMATRRIADKQFDHGAQYFTARDERFVRQVASWRRDGIVRQWRGRIVVLQDGHIKEEKNGAERFVAVPAMNAVCKHLAAGLDVRPQSLISPLKRVGNRWLLSTAASQEVGEYDLAVASAPPKQSAELLQHAPQLSERVRATTMHGCWAVMLALSEPLAAGFDGAFVHESPLSWIARNCSKPGRPHEPETWVIHASPAWTGDHFDLPPEAARDLLMEEFWKAVGRAPQAIAYLGAHRWRYSLPPEPLAESCLFDAQLGIGACGDWCAGPRVEGAFLSGQAMAERVLAAVRRENNG